MKARRLAKRLLKVSPAAQRVYRAYRRREQDGLLPNWGAILATEPELWRQALERSKTGPKVLLATSHAGMPTAPILDSLLAVALTLRGARVEFLLCDAALPACVMGEVGLVPPRGYARDGPQRHLCASCVETGERILAPLGLKVHRLSALLRPEDVALAEGVARDTAMDAIPTYTLRGAAVGEHSLAGTLRYFARASLEGEPAGEAILRRYLAAGVRVGLAMERVLDRGFDVVSAINGIYVPQGIVAEVARRRGVRVCAWNVAYRKSSFIFSHGETYHHTLMNEPTSVWENMPWGPAKEDETLDYLRSRRRGGRDWIVFQHDGSEQDADAIVRRLGIDPARPIIGMLTNVAWDAQLHYPANAFPNMLDWVVETVEHFASRPDLQLVVRVHPAEVSGDIPSRQPVVEAIRKRWPTLPHNVFVIGPEQAISTYAIMERANAVLIYGTKTGVELASMGIPVVVAGEAWIRNKGLTIDAKSAEHYFRILEGLPLRARMPPAQVERARKYAYHFFFRRMLTIAQVEPTGTEPQFRIAVESLQDLLPGSRGALDVVVDGILRNAPFVFDPPNDGATA